MFAGIYRDKLWKRSLVIVALTAAPILLAHGGSQGAAPQSTPAPATPQTQPTPPPAGQEGQARPQGERRGGPKIPDTFTNLKILPPDVKKPELIKVMPNFSIQLGVRCHFCHEVNDDLTEGSFASDAKDEKQTARLMLKMVSQINDDYISKVPNMPAPATCWTCHRGKSTPEQFVPPAPPTAAPSAPPKPGEAPPNSQSAPQGTPPAGTPPPNGPPK